jgi:hypothetical protein
VRITSLRRNLDVGNPSKNLKDWKDTTLGEIGGGGQYGLNAAAMSEGTGVRFIRITDIDDMGQLGRCPPAFVPVPTPNLNLYELSEGDILLPVGQPPEKLPSRYW